MAPLAGKTCAKKEEHTVKRGTVGKLTAEVRRRVPDAKIVKNNYYVNRAKQVNKIVINYRHSAPLNIDTHTNNVYIKYSPAVFSCPEQL